MSSVAEGTIIDGKYQVEHVLGEGGMGIVVAARHVQLGQRVAIKFLRNELVAKPHVIERFMREARASVQIESEHVVRVLDVGLLEDGAPYMVMEYLEGTDLAELLDAKGPLSVHDAVDAVLQACVALAEAHSLGIVHRDLKPANLFRIVLRDGSPSVKLLDFGISKVTSPDIGRSTDHLTTQHGMLGTVLYMSPEQLRSASEVDARSDIWSLGVVLFELLTKRFPFDANSLPEVTLKIAMDEPLSARASRPDMDAGIEPIIARCLAKSPANRYDNVAELAQALAPFGTDYGRACAAATVRIVDLDPNSRVPRPKTPPPPRPERVQTLPAVVPQFTRPRSPRTSSAVALVRTDTLLSVPRRHYGALLGVFSTLFLVLLFVGAVDRGWVRIPAFETSFLRRAPAAAGPKTVTADRAPPAHLSDVAPATPTVVEDDPQDYAPAVLDSARAHAGATDAHPRAHGAQSPSIATGGQTAPERDPSHADDVKPAVPAAAQAAKEATQAAAATAPATSPAPSPTTVSDDCFPPYTVAADGTKVPKAECQ